MLLLRMILSIYFRAKSKLPTLACKAFYDPDLISAALPIHTQVNKETFRCTFKKALQLLGLDPEIHYSFVEYSLPTPLSSCFTTHILLQLVIPYSTFTLNLKLFTLENLPSMPRPGAELPLDVRKLISLITLLTFYYNDRFTNCSPAKYLNTKTCRVHHSILDSQHQC